jgi:ribosome biogenesis GTPase A
MENSAMPINWYPGHMAKTKRLLSDQIRKVDLILELCDARLPHSSRNPEINRLAGGKKRIVLLNKADLADPAETAKWLKVIRASGTDAFATNSTMLKTKEIIQLIQKSTKDAVDRALARGVRKTVKVMVLGVPNVGKSTLINALRGKGIAQTGDRPGVTKSNQWIRISPYLELLDTPGMLWPRLDDQQAAKRLCYIGSVKDDVTDLYLLSLSLLGEMMETCPDRVMDRFHVNDPFLRGQELIDAVCRGRGWLLKGGECDYDRASRVILDEFRGGKLGRITLEKAPEQGKDVNEKPAGTGQNDEGEAAAPGRGSKSTEEVNP